MRVKRLRAVSRLFAVLNARFLRIADSLLNAALLAFLVTLLSIDVFGFTPASRVFTTLVSLLLLARRTSSPVLGWTALVQVGNVSYSIYLVHWPIFTLHRYVYASFYVRPDSHAPFGVGLQLICSTLVLALVLEEANKRLAARITNWRRLFAVCILGYGLVGSGLFLARIQGCGSYVSCHRCQCACKVVRF